LGKIPEDAEEILVENKIKYSKAVGEAAMYGPKMDLISKDSLGRYGNFQRFSLTL